MSSRSGNEMDPAWQDNGPARRRQIWVDLRAEGDRCKLCRLKSDQERKITQWEREPVVDAEDESRCPDGLAPRNGSDGWARRFGVSMEAESGSSC